MPRWGARAHDDWYPWIAAELARTGTFGPVIVGEMPQPDEPTIPAWTTYLAERAGPDRAVLARTVLVGHSVGCQAILHVLEAMPASVRVKGTLCVAGWWQVDDPWPSIQPWLDASLDLARIRARCGFLGVLLSDDDPFTSDADRNRRLWVDRLGATVAIVPGAAHFNHQQEPEVLAALQRWYAD